MKFKNQDNIDISSNYGVEDAVIEEDSRYISSYSQPKNNSKDYFDIIFNKKINKKIDLNNGEPIGMAFPKVIKELGFLFVIAIFIVVGFYGAHLLHKRSTDSSTYYLTLDRTYKEEQSIDVTEFDDEFSTNSVLDTVAKWANVKNDNHFDSEISTSKMKTALENMLPNSYIETETDIDNYTLLVKIYEHLKKDIPVIVSVAQPETKDLGYAIIEGLYLHDNKISVVSSNLSKEVMTLDEFISHTRYEIDKLGFEYEVGIILGKYKINNAYFIDEIY